MKSTPARLSAGLVYLTLLFAAVADDAGDDTSTSDTEETVAEIEKGQLAAWDALCQVSR